MLSKSLMVRNNGTEEYMQMLTDGIRTTTELLLIYTLSNNRTNVKLITDFMELDTFQSQDFQNFVRRAGPITFYLPVSLSSLADLNENCIISQVIFIKGNPYNWGESSVKINENVADLTLYSCKTRRKIDVNGLTSPVIIEFQKSIINETSELNFSLLQNKMNIHQFNVTSDKQTEYLQITLNFTRPPERVFPIMILFRKFERPTPQLYNFQQVFKWKGNTVQLFLSPDLLNAKGSYYLALLSANYDRKPTNKYTASAVSYYLSIQWISCLYWDNVKEWKTDGCLPMQSLSSSKLNCSCNHLTIFSMSSREARNCFESIYVSPFQSHTDNLVPCIVIFLTLIFYIPLAFLCKRFDIQNEKKRAPVYLQDNNPSDKQLYAICIDTGFRSRTYTTAKIYIVLHGEDGVSETRELHCPQKTLFERNSRDIFIMSTPYTLGPIWRIQLWHNNGGHSPSWYLSHVIVKDLADSTCWFFMAETWLAVDEGDGKVERDLTPLRKCPGFKKVLYCKLTEFLEDFHIWASVYSRPSHSHFSHSQRLAVCLFLFLGYMTLNSVILFIKDEEYSAELGLINTSTVSLITGCFSVIAVLPVGLLLSLLFRFSKVKFNKESPVEQLSSTEASAIYNVEVNRNSVILQDGTFESYLSWQNLQMWAEEAWKKKYEHGLSEQASHVYSKTFRKETGLYSSDGCSSGFEDCSLPESKVPGIISSNDLCSVYSSEHGRFYEQPVFSDNKTFLPYWCQYAAWSICILLSVICIVVTVCVGLTFNLTKSICWIHSLFFSLLFCIFVLQPILIFITALAVTLKCNEISNIYVGFHKTNPNFESRKWQPSKDSCLSKKCLPTFDHKHLASSLDYDKLIAARQRARYLRLVRPPSLLQLREARERIRKETLIQQTLREIILHTLLLLLLLFITYGRFSTNQNLVNRAIHHNFIRNAKKPFTELNSTEDWWNWSFTSLINGLCYDSFCKNAVTNTEAVPARGLFKLIGEPVLWKIHAFDKTDCNIVRVYKDFSFSSVPPDNSTIYNTRKQTFVGIFHLCGQIECYNERKTALTLGRTRTEMIDTLTQLKSVGWLDKNTKAVVVQFTLYNPPSNLFTTVSLLMEISAGTVFSSTLIESANVYQIISICDYLIMAFELLFLILIFLQLYFQICTMIIKGFIVYWQESWNWLEMVIIITGLFRFLYYIYQFHLVMEVIDELQKQNFMTFIDIRILSYVEQFTRSLQGIVIFLFLIKYIHLFRVNKVMAPCVARLRLSSFNTVISVLTGLIIIIAYTCLGNLLFMSAFHPFSTIKRSFQTLLSQFLGASELKTLSSLYHTHQLSVTIFSGTFFFIMTIFWTAMMIGTFTSFSHDAKKSSRSKHFVTFKEVVIYARERFFNYICGRGQKLFDSYSIMNNNHYLDEFETLMDELLFRLNSLSNSLYHFLPAKQRLCLEEDSTIAYQSDCYFTQDSENSLLNGDCFETPFHNFQQDMLLRDHLQMYELFMQSASCLNHSLMNQRVRSEMEEAAFHHLQMNKLSRAVLGYSSHNNLGQAQSQNALDSSSSTTKHQSLIEATSQSLAILNSCEVAHQTQNLNSSLSVNHELYNLSKLGNAFPHILCGINCSEKVFLMPTMQQPISAGLTAKGRKLLRRSQTTVINPFEIQRDLTKGIAENNGKCTRKSGKKEGLDKQNHCQQY
ncbi:polycystic kidney disease protein 1-like 1 [Erpetoichthys calabaricus]|uniref:polycystic kidney disease protein 1-like 1 n=1 Tax=Erpetoichthys calabaricus TaxID=27687 RepID=UPI0022345AAC|nr:polycystic kidney disease protein 1-like 1 [Erpetoichthys calabaricus]